MCCLAWLAGCKEFRHICRASGIANARLVQETSACYGRLVEMHLECVRGFAPELRVLGGVMQKVIAGLLAIVVVLLAVICYQLNQSEALPAMTSQYQTVVLSTGQVYFGKLEKAAGDNYILRDVFYVLSQSDPESRQVSNILVRRGKELHGPDYMVLRRSHVIMIEPVGDNSRVAQLIAEQAQAGK